ncbi:MAG: tyrosine-type recombinase/integrase [Acidobacteriota bacterium]
MSTDLPIPRALARAGFGRLPAPIASVGERAHLRFIEFFTANIRNPNTRRAYAQAVSDFFAWCGERGIWNLTGIQPSIVAAWLEDLQTTHSKPTVKQRLAAVRMLFDWLVVGNVVSVNPASSVRGPKHVVKRGRTPVLTVEETRALLDSIDTGSVVGLRDKALISVLVYSFARIGAALAMKVEDYYPQGKRWWFRLHEKGGKRHDVPAHHKAEAAVDAYIEAAGIRDDKKGPVFRTAAKGPGRPLTHAPMRQSDAWRMIRRRTRAAGIDTECCCHTFRATGITAYLQGGGTLEHAQQIAAHESPRTTKLYDRTRDQITLDEIERIAI